MRRLGVGIAVAAVAVVVSLVWLAGHHVVRAEEGWILLRKKYVGAADTWADVRGWHYSDYESHRALKTALREQGYDAVLREARRREVRDQVDQWAGDLGAAAEEGIRLFTDALDDSQELSELIEQKMAKWNERMAGRPGGEQPAGGEASP